MNLDAFTACCSVPPLSPEAPLDQRAMHTLFFGQIPAESLAICLTRPAAATNQANKLKAALVEDLEGTVHIARLSNMLKRLTKANPWLSRVEAFTALTERTEVTALYLSAKLLRQASIWAEKTMRDNPALAVALCSTGEGPLFVRRGLDIALAPRHKQGTKAQQKQFEKQITAKLGARGRLASIFVNNAMLSEPEAIVLASEEIAGGLREAMRYTLVHQYDWVVNYVMTATLGAIEVMTRFKHYVNFDNVEFLESVFNDSELLQYYGQEGRIMLSNPELAELLAEKNYTTMQTLESMVNLFDGQTQKHEAACRTLQREALSLNQEIVRQQGLITALRSDLQTNPEATRLAAENGRLKKQLDDALARASRKENPPVAAARPIAPTPPAAPLPVTPTPPAPPPPPQDAFVTLRGLRGVLIGGHPTFLKKLRALLPGWAFYSADEKNVDGPVVRNAEVVVMFTTHCNHPLTEAVQKLVRPTNTPLVYSTRVNPPAFAVEVASQLKTQWKLSI